MHKNSITLADNLVTSRRWSEWPIGIARLPKGLSPYRLFVVEDNNSGLLLGKEAPIMKPDSAHFPFVPTFSSHLLDQFSQWDLPDNTTLSNLYNDSRPASGLMHQLLPSMSLNSCSEVATICYSQQTSNLKLMAVRRVSGAQCTQCCRYDVLMLQSHGLCVCAGTFAHLG